MSGHTVNNVNNVNQLMSKYNLIFQGRVGKIPNTLQAATYLKFIEPIFRNPLKLLVNN